MHCYLLSMLVAELDNKDNGMRLYNNFAKRETAQ